MDLRAYFFGNMYLSSIQQGIQAAHVIADMFVKYKPIISEDYEISPPTSAQQMLNVWADEDKTMVLLNAGYGTEIRDLLEVFDTINNPYPFAMFCESDDALDSAATCIGIILPETIYNASKLIRDRVLDPEVIEHMGAIDYFDETNGKRVTYSISKWEYNLIMRLNHYGMAR